MEAPAVPNGFLACPANSSATPCEGGGRHACCDCYSGWDLRELVPSSTVGGGLPDGDIYQFGVFAGASLRRLRGRFPHTHIWGFDSFEGLPDDPAERFPQLNFREGAYRFPASRMHELTRELGRQRTTLIRGFFSASLTPQLRREHPRMRPAVYIDVDADLYRSTLEALTWMLEQKLAVAGTLVGYDDWWASPCSRNGEELHPLDTGEGRAHLEVALRHNVSFECVGGPCSARLCSRASYGTLFRIRDVGGSPSHGFDFSAAELRAWKATNAACRHKHRLKNHKVLARRGRDGGEPASVPSSVRARGEREMPVRE